MEKLIVILAQIFLVSAVYASDYKVEVKKVWTLPDTFKIKNNKVGGLSGCAFSDNRFYFVSDDKGSDGGPRFISFAFDSQRQEIDFNQSEVVMVQLKKSEKVLDLEGIGILSKDLFLLSSEGDLNQKPRLNPSIFWVNGRGERLREVTFPAEYLPEKTGRQTKGVQNNLAFEGLVVDLEYKTWAAMLEAPLFQGPKELKLIESAMDSEKFDHTYSYPVPTPFYAREPVEKPMTAYFGVSEILYLTKDSFLVLERGATLTQAGIGFQTQLCGATKKDASSLSRKCFYNMNEDSNLAAVIPQGANFEGLCWVNKQKKIFLTVSDNNFSKNQKTVFILYQLN